MTNSSAFTPLKSYLNRTFNSQGFALVIAISLMAFILLLVVSMSVLVTLETGLATQKRAEIEARQNALFELQVAVGDLQRTARRGRRVYAFYWLRKP